MSPSSFLLPLLALGALGCASSAPAPEAEGALPSAQASRLDGPDYHYFRATRDGRECPWPACGGYVVRPVGDAVASCGAAPASAECYVADIDLGATDLARDEGRVLLGRIGSDGSAFSLVFVGSVEVRTGGDGVPTPVLQAREVWEATTPVPASSRMHHLTRATTPCAVDKGCTAVDSVSLGDWARLRSATVRLQDVVSDRVYLANLPQCATGQTSFSSPVFDLAVASRTGVLAAGTRSAAAFVTTGFFVKHMGEGACDHHHGGRALECCGMSAHCLLSLSNGDALPAPGPGATRRPPPPGPDCKTDHILGGIEFEYERSKEIAGWLTATHQPTSPTAHAHPAPTP